MCANKMSILLLLLNNNNFNTLIVLFFTELSAGVLRDSAWERIRQFSLNKHSVICYERK